jgi:hypothetical protein
MSEGALSTPKRRTVLVRRLATFGTLLTIALAGFMASVTPANAGCQTVAIWSTDTDQYVSVELDDRAFPGMLRARASAIGPWERFTMCVDGLNYFTLRSLANGMYVSVEHDYSGRYQHMLRARTAPANLGGWEKFLLEDWGDIVAFKTDRGAYVSAEFGYSGAEKGMLRGRGTYRGPWESYEYSYA